MRERETVYLVDDDDGMRQSLDFLLRSAGFQVESFASGDELLAVKDWAHPSCLILDLRLEEMSGLELRDQLRARGCSLPTIMISGRAEIPEVVAALKQGVLDFLGKPFRDQELIEKAREAIRQSIHLRENEAKESLLRRRFDSLTHREREVLTRVVAGKVNKAIAVELGVSQKTIEYHRKNVMNKLNVVSVPELVRLAMSVDEVAESVDSEQDDHRPAPHDATLRANRRTTRSE